MEEKNIKIINLARDFSRYPAGREPKDGPNNGQKFRKEIIIPALNNYDQVNLVLDEALGYGSSFLEEAFGGLIREGFSKKELETKIVIQTKDSSLDKLIWQYINEESERLI